MGSEPGVRWQHRTPSTVEIIARKEKEAARTRDTPKDVLMAEADLIAIKYRAEIKASLQHKRTTCLPDKVPSKNVANNRDVKLRLSRRAKSGGNHNNKARETTRCGNLDLADDHGPGDHKNTCNLEKWKLSPVRIGNLQLWIRIRITYTPHNILHWWCTSAVSGGVIITHNAASLSTHSFIQGLNPPWIFFRPPICSPPHEF